MTFHWKKYIAEGIGAAALTLMVLTSIRFHLPLSTPLIAGLTLGFFVYAIGGISGSHINPAVTVGLWSVKKINSTDAVGYVVFQIVGALLTQKVFEATFSHLPVLPNAVTLPIAVAEAAGAAVLLFGISAAVMGKVSAGASGLLVGGSLLLGILLASTVSNGVLNPAVAIGLGSISWPYIVGPVVGAVASCQLYRWLVS